MVVGSLSKPVLELDTLPAPPHSPLTLSLLSLFEGSISLLFLSTLTMDEPQGTIIFTTNGLPYFGFDIFSLSLPPNPNPNSISSSSETLHTDGLSVNFNASFTDSDSSLTFVSERTGKALLYQTLYGKSEAVPLCADLDTVFTDRPVLKNGRLYFVSAHEKPSEQFKSWAAVYETELDSTRSGPVRRLSPVGTVDLSPAVSQSGEFIAVASHGSGKWKGDFRELETEIVVFPVKEPSERRVMAGHGGWPTWQGDSVLFFHRKDEDGWWSVYKADPTGRPATRVTPPGVHAFTPAASHDKKWIAVATRRKGRAHRHIELFDLESKEFHPVTELINPNLHHYNPFFSCDSSKLGYHRFRGESAKGDNIIPHLQTVHSPVRTLKMVRVNGTFPSFSPDGGLIAINGDLLTTPGLMVVKSDGSKRWTLIEQSSYFHTAWSPAEKGVIFASVGPIFESVKSTVQIARVSFNVSDLQTETEKVNASVKILTSVDKGNNAFASISPDGNKLVFRSGRSGFKNLYIINAINGETESEEIFQLTKGEWIDTMPSWSPDGKLIAFSSNQHDPNDPTGFGLYLIRPDGSSLRRVHISGHEDRADLAKERINHVCFSPDSKWLLFTANFGAVLAEPVSGPNHFQPYGDLYACRVDGSGLVRLTCNAYENGTPAWHGAIGGLEGLSVGEPIGDKLRGQFEEPLWLTCDF